MDVTEIRSTNQYGTTVVTRSFTPESANREVSARFSAGHTNVVFKAVEWSPDGVGPLVVQVRRR